MIKESLTCGLMCMDDFLEINVVLKKIQLNTECSISVVLTAILLEACMPAF